MQRNFIREKTIIFWNLICNMAWARKQSRICSINIKQTYKETPALVTKQFCGILKQKTSKRSQFDLTDLRVIGPVTFKGKQYRYILTVEDGFSSFVWLRPLKDESSLLVYKSLKKLYHEHEPPLLLQCNKEHNLRVMIKG